MDGKMLVSQRRQVSHGICGIANAAHQARVLARRLGSDACAGLARRELCRRAVGVGTSASVPQLFNHACTSSAATVAWRPALMLARVFSTCWRNQSSPARFTVRSLCRLHNLIERRSLARDRSAMHDAAVTRLVPAATAVQRRAVVPDHEVELPPAVTIDKAQLRGCGQQIL